MAVPELVNAVVLRKHFHWLIDGDTVFQTVQKNLVPRISDLELYLREEGRKDVNNELTESRKIGATFYAASGDLYMVHCYS